MSTPCALKDEAEEAKEEEELIEEGERKETEQRVTAFREAEREGCKQTEETRELETEEQKRQPREQAAV